jgi:hypothetical protein
MYPTLNPTGPMDLIHVGTISRGQNKVPCQFYMNTKPTAYALVYQSKRKKDLAYARLFELTGFHERVCPEELDLDLPNTSVILPTSAFANESFIYGQPYPAQDPPAQDASKLQLVP